MYKLRQKWSFDRADILGGFFLVTGLPFPQTISNLAEERRPRACRLMQTIGPRYRKQLPSQTGKTFFSRAQVGTVC